MDKRITKFRELADKLQKQIDDKRDPAISTQNLTARRARIAEGMAQNADKLEEIQNVLYGMADGIENNSLPKSLMEIKNKLQIEVVLRAIRYKYKIQDIWQEGERKRLIAANIANETFEQAKTDMKQYLKGQSEEVLKKKKLKELENSLIGTKIPGFFPTPKSVIDMMLDLADIQHGTTVLEPSAGKGDIVEAIEERNIRITNLAIIEINHTLVSILEAKGHNPLLGDFLEHKEHYDYIIQNPPFEKGQDMDHIKHAYSLLHSGGRLVSIISEGPFFRSDKKSIAFREWVDKVECSIQNLDDVFKGSESFRQTGVKSKIIVIDKPETPKEIKKENIIKIKENNMELKINKKELSKVLFGLQNITNSKSNLAITSSILLIAKDNSIEIQATDLDMWYQGFCPAKVTIPGSIAIPFKELSGFVQKIKTVEISIIEKENLWLEISGGSTVFNLVCSDADDFPVMQKIDNVGEVKIDANDFRDMIDKTIVIPHPRFEDFKVYKAGVCFEIITKEKQDYARMVSTDGGQLSTVDKKLLNASELSIGEKTLIPKKGLEKLNRIFLKNIKKQKDEKQGLFQVFKDFVTLRVSQDWLVVKKQKMTIAIRLLEGEFPDYVNMLIPKKKNIIIVNKDILLKSFKQMIAMQDSDYLAMMTYIEPNVMKMVFTNPNIGEAKEEIKVEYKGNSFEVAFNPKQFVDILSVMKSDVIYLNIIDAVNPCIITGNKDEDFTALIMPCRI